MNNTQLSTIVRAAIDPTINTQAQIAEATGISQPTISRVLARDDVRALVEEQQNLFLMSSLAKSRTNIEYAIEQYKTTKDKDIREHGYKASIEVLRGIGMLPSHAPSVFIQQIFNTTVNVNPDPLVQQVLDKFGSALSAPDAIDVDYEDAT